MDKGINQKKPWFKKWWVWAIIIVVLIGIGGAGTNTQQKAAETPANTTTQEPKAEEKPAAKWDMEAAYAKINNGMTKAQVAQAIGKEPESCTESQSEYIGKSELCTYGNAFIDKGAIIVTYMQDKVSSKTKSTY
jgi:hypothetical protein